MGKRCMRLEVRFPVNCVSFEVELAVYGVVNIIYTKMRRTAYPAIKGTFAHLPARMDLVGGSLKTMLSSVGNHWLNNSGLFPIYT